MLEGFPDAVTLSRAVRDKAGRAVDMRLEYVNRVAAAGQPDGVEVVGGLCSELWPQMLANGSFAACMRVLDTGIGEAGAFWWTEQESYAVAGYDYKAERIGSDLLLWVLRDRTDAIRAELGERARFHAAFQAASVGMAILDPYGGWLEINHTLSELLGVDQIAGGPGHLQAFVHPDDQAALRARMDDPSGGPVELRLVSTTQGLRWAQVTLAPIDAVPPAPVQLLAHVVDVTQAKYSNDRVAHVATHDPLTGLPNRQLLTDRLERALVRARQTRRQVGIIHLDLDRFGHLNGSLGPQAGDHTLQTVARRLASTLPVRDTLGRPGSDEFIVIRDDLPEDLAADAMTAAATGLIKTLADPAQDDIAVSASCGVAIGGGNASAETLVQQAGVALAAAKEKGGGHTEMYVDEFQTRTHGHFQVETMLRAGLRQGDAVEVHYQPIHRLDDHTLVAMEALVRWRHDGRLLPPAAFLDVAETSGLVVELGRQVRARALHQLARWRRTASAPGAAHLNLNVCARELTLPELAHDILVEADHLDIPATELTIEVTESALLSNPTTALHNLHELRGGGCRVALDDFGTGYSSLAQLRELPIDTLKIDRRFVTTAADDHRDRAVLEAFSSLGRTLDLNLVAEGIETEQQRHTAAAAGCHLGQGFLFARPQPAADLPTLFA